VTTLRLAYGMAIPSVVSLSVVCDYIRVTYNDRRIVIAYNLSIGAI